MSGMPFSVSFSILIYHEAADESGSIIVTLLHDLYPRFREGTAAVSCKGLWPRRELIFVR